MKSNPVLKIRKELGLTRNEFSTLLKVSYDSIYKVEKGIVRQPYMGIIKGLKNLGYDEEKIIKDYKKFHNEIREEIIEYIKTQNSLNGGEASEYK
ncbi:MAG: hypothetical protein ACOCP4_05375 [Candidatus Woesearchaeota archaeon]